MPKVNWSAINSLARAKIGASHPIKDSPLSNPKVQELAQGEAINSLREAQIGASPALAGSPLSNPKVQELAQGEAINSLREAQIGASPALAGSPLSNPKVQELAQGEAIASLSQVEIRKAPPKVDSVEVAQTIAKTAEAAQKQGPGCIFMAKNALNGGELSPDVAARFDQPRWQTGCHELLNMVPLAQGGITRRPGFEHLCEPFGSDGSLTTTIIYPFVFSANESRMLEFSSDGDSGGIMRVYMPDGDFNKDLTQGTRIPWGKTHLGHLCFAQSADVLYVAHPDFPPKKICRYADDDWRIEDIQWLPSISPPVCHIGWEGNPGEWNWSMQLSTYKYVVTAVDKDTGDESTPSAEVELRNVVPVNSTGYYITVTIDPVPNAFEYRVYKKQGSVYGYIGRVPSDAARLVFEDRNIVPDTEDTPPEAKNPFDGPGNYPSIVFLHQQRLGFAASHNRPLTIWLSQSGNYESMASSVPPKDDEAIEVTLAANQANRILWCVSDRDVLAVGTEGSEWTLAGAEGNAITPSNLAFQGQTSYGSQGMVAIGTVRAIKANDTLLYLQRGGRIVREFNYSFSSDRYQSGELTLLARHITRERSIQSWAWMPEPYPLLWCVLSDGTLAALTYIRDQEIVAWSRHATNGVIERVATIPDPSGNWQLWITVNRDNGSGHWTRRIERLRPFANGPQNGKYFLDGLPEYQFEARCIPCLPETNLQTGTTFTRIRKINAVKARVMNCGTFRARVLGQDMPDSPEMMVPARGAGFVDLADFDCPLGAGWREGAKLELVFDWYEPATVLGLMVTVELADLGGSQG